MSTVLDYTGRRVDVLALQGSASGAATAPPLRQELAGADVPGGRIVAGITKLAQRWALEFLTEAGSLLYLPLRGCTFLTEARQGLLRNEMDVAQSFNISAGVVQRNLDAEDADTDPDDERLDTASLENVALHGGQLELRIRILSRAGSSRRILLPLEVSTL